MEVHFPDLVSQKSLVHASPSLQMIAV